MRWWWLTVMILTSGCGLPTLSPEHGLPPLVELTGTARLPSGFRVLADTASAPRHFRTELRSWDGAPLARGTVVDDQGAFSVSIPASLLGNSPDLYALSLLDTEGRVIYNAPVPLHSRSDLDSLQIDAVSSTLWLAAREATRKNLNPLRWDLARMATDEKVRAYALRVEQDVAAWSNTGNGVTLLVASRLPQDFQVQLDQIIREAPLR